MPLPDFFLIGAAKSGTTALYLVLAQHPEIYMSPVKEPYFFACPGARPESIDPRYGLPRDMISDRGRYLELFSAVGQELVTGEATMYMHTPGAAARIRGEIPDARLVAVLRNPVARAYSSYWFLSEIGVERAPTFEAALEQERMRMAEGWRRGLFQDGLYHAQLAPYFDLFPRAQIRIYLYEDWRSRPRQLLRDLYGFLGVAEAADSTPTEVNASRAPRVRWVREWVRRTGPSALKRLDVALNRTAPPPMRMQTRRRLQADYREDITKLQRLIDRDLSGWLA